MIIEKPWGREEILEKNDKYMLKRLTMYKGKRCSLQYHNKKLETIYILNGELRIYTKDISTGYIISDIYKPNETITIPQNVIHRMEAIEDTIYLEASTPEIDDVVRLEDDYNRN